MNQNQSKPLRRLPFPNWWPVLGGALFGVLLRLIFWGDPDTRFPLGAMHPAFIGFGPLAVGAITVYVAELSARRSWGYYMVAGMLANCLFIAATMVIMIEGLICAILILPLFSVYGGLGGLLMGAICRGTNWPKKPAVYSFALMPLLLGVLIPDGAGEPFLAVIERTLVVNAEAPVIWRQLLDTRGIQEAELGQAWMYRIGVPMPISGVTRSTPEGLVRDIRMGKGIHFSQHSTQWKLNRYVRWTYRFDENSFPPGALDDHVKIGGQYFDVIDTEYVLTPAGTHSTALTVRMHYRVSTQFNWYAKILASGLIGNFEEAILRFYKGRST
ncbi:SRPBCC domain-containing protein [Oxalobacteraceae bacterium]|nr:SRPBCC domain-containing protein [Oxalobacteraceae bacterium]